MLEQQMYKIPRIKERIYSVRDLENLSVSVLYTGDLPPMKAAGAFISGRGYGDLPDIPLYGFKNIIKESSFENGSIPIIPKSIGSISDFKKEGLGNISINLDLGKFVPEAKKYSLTERYDTTHGQFHLNQDLINELRGKIINSGKSKKNEDGFKGLGSAHNIDLFNL